ncbi:MAG: hypothetical protein F6K25_00470 [Okeania sp. SIO2G4]|uniref:hypothetical protein n=1 Tax=unclassified Okeania TaxID=2634635 RepID=UPI0013BBCC81|nr:MULTISPECIES: hypothetical protein [unclassified Okeania]NEP06583.1 hypothetical protein [Okeania sp. SIO4D6]NEP70638.1 hypothetical protein [Okeania sp. SIO2G5]NEP91882.1 hypothetical protein [Okeania sp. SIO2F5]NEQ89306.1 hypothetical protein [Okeania sp. SIO2G4]
MRCQLYYYRSKPTPNPSQEGKSPSQESGGKKEEETGVEGESFLFAGVQRILSPGSKLR